MHASRLLILAFAFVPGCGGPGGPGESTAADATSNTLSASSSTAGDSGSSASDVVTTSGDPSESSAPATTAGTDTTTDATAGGVSDAGADGSTGPTSGPGVLPGETGIDAFCRRYFECGGTNYVDEQDCVDQGVDYWGACPMRRMALDAFGACMSEIACEDYDPDAYNPNATPCARLWQELLGTPGC